LKRSSPEKPLRSAAPYEAMRAVAIGGITSGGGYTKKDIKINEKIDSIFDF
jgi:hypothetical protein